MIYIYICYTICYYSYSSYYYIYIYLFIFHQFSHFENPPFFPGLRCRLQLSQGLPLLHRGWTTRIRQSLQVTQSCGQQTPGGRYLTMALMGISSVCILYIYVYIYVYMYHISYTYIVCYILLIFSMCTLLYSFKYDLGYSILKDKYIIGVRAI